MFSNYLKLALRLLQRNPLNTTINVLGLSSGFAMFFILWQYSQSELNSDRFHDGFERVVRFGTIYRFSDTGTIKEGKLAVNDPELTKSIATEFPEIEDYTRVFLQANFSKDQIPFHGQEIFMTTTGTDGQRKSFVESGIAYADANLLSFFNFPLLRGSRQSVLVKPYSIIISQRMARKYFGNDDAVGKTLLLNDVIPLNVTGVFKDLPHNTHLAFEMVISSSTIERTISTIGITNGGPYCYFRLRPGTDRVSLDQQIKRFADERFNSLLKASCSTCDSEAYLQPLSELPFNTGYWFDQTRIKSRYLLVALATISILVLVMAWINYVNLAVTANLKRIKELAARKTVGARPADFVLQFLIESFLLNGLSAAAAIVIVQILRSPAEQFLEFYIPDLQNISLSTLLISSSTLFLGVLCTGLFPAWIALRSNPEVLFRRARSLKSKDVFSKTLTTVQFSFAVILITWVFGIHLQLDYILNKDLGIRKDEVITLDLPIVQNSASGSQISAFVKEVSAVAGVSDRCVSNSIPGVQSKFLVFWKNGRSFSPQTSGGVDERFIPFYEIKLLAGRNFAAESPSDRTAIIISRTTAVQMGMKDPSEAVGQHVEVNTAEWTDGKTTAEIIGVVEDYKVDPLFASVTNRDGIALTYKNYMLPTTVPPRRISLRIDDDHFKEAIASVEIRYNSVFSGNVFNWNFLDQQIRHFYDQEKTTRNQVSFFTALAIAIACLGLLGIIRNKAVEKTKEMGLRKVLGARFHHLSVVLLGTTIRQVVIAVVIGIPGAIFLIRHYLEKFSERIPLQWWHYVVPVCLLTLIMAATIASTLLKVNKTNPVEALRYE